MLGLLASSLENEDIHFPALNIPEIEKLLKHSWRFPSEL